MLHAVVQYLCLVGKKPARVRLINHLSLNVTHETQQWFRVMPKDSPWLKLIWMPAPPPPHRPRCSGLFPQLRNMHIHFTGELNCPCWIVCLCDDPASGYVPARGSNGTPSPSPYPAKVCFPKQERRLGSMGWVALFSLRKKIKEECPFKLIMLV